MKKSTKRKIYRISQSVIQHTYMCMFITWVYILMFVSKFATLEEMKPLIIGVCVTGFLTIGKGIYYLRTPSNRKKVVKEIKAQLRSENGIKF